MSVADPELHQDIKEFCHQLLKDKFTGTYDSQADVDRQLNTLKTYDRFQRRDPEWTAALPSSYKALETLLGKAYGAQLFKYDICSHCHSCIYRCEYENAVTCPRCTTPRFQANGRAQASMYYAPHPGVHQVAA